jgi:hypothetical protein
MRTTFLTISIFLALTSFGQRGADIMFATQDAYVFPEEVPFGYLLADEVSLRSCPSDTCGLQAILRIGSRLSILEQSDTIITLSGIRSYWYKVKTENRSGWLWGGFIAQQSFGSHVNPEIKFVSGYEEERMDNKMRRPAKYYQIRAFKANEQLDKIVVRSFAWDFGEVKHIGNKGLNNVDDIFEIHVPCTGGCGCSTGEIYVFWNGHKFYHVADVIGMADGEYSEYENFVFPSDMEGIPGIIIKQSGRMMESEMEREVIREFYEWTGAELQMSKKKPERYTYIID